MRKRCFPVLIIVAVLFTLTISTAVASAATTIKLNKSNVTIAKGGSYTLKLKGAKAKKVKWKSKKSKIIKVRKGKITAQNKGTTYVIAKYRGKKYKCTIKVMSKKALNSKCISAYDWHCEDIWNEGYCNIYHYIESGTDAVGDEMDINETISRLNKKWKKRSKWNKFVYSIVGSKYTKFKRVWKKTDKQAVRLKKILDENGAPEPNSDYYFPCEKYSDLIWDLMAACPY